MRRPRFELKLNYIHHHTDTNRRLMQKSFLPYQRINVIRDVVVVYILYDERRSEELDNVINASSFSQHILINKCKQNASTERQEIQHDLTPKFRTCLSAAIRTLDRYKI